MVWQQLPHPGQAGGSSSAGRRINKLQPTPWCPLARELWGWAAEQRGWGLSGQVPAACPGGQPLTALPGQKQPGATEGPSSQGSPLGNAPSSARLGETGRGSSHTASGRTAPRNDAQTHPAPFKQGLYFQWLFIKGAGPGPGVGDRRQPPAGGPQGRALPPCWDGRAQPDRPRTCGQGPGSRPS